MKHLHRQINIALVILFFSCNQAFAQGNELSLYYDQLTIREGLSHNSVYCLLQDRHGYIWAGTQNGLNKYDGYSFEVFRSREYQPGNAGFLGKTISSLFEDRHGNLWVGTRKQGINILYRGKDTFQNLQDHPAFKGIRGFDVSSIQEDKTGHIWITTVGRGVLKFDPATSTSVHYHAKNSGLSNNLTFDVVEDQNGVIWVGASGVGLNYLEPGSNQFQLDHVDIDGDTDMDGYRKSFYLDGNELWIGTEGSGLYLLDLTSGSYKHFPIGEGLDEINSNVIRNVLKSRDGRIFIATDGAGLAVYDKSTGHFSKFTDQPGRLGSLNSNALYSLLEDRTGNIWVGTYNGGINIYRTHKTWFQLYTPVIAQQTELVGRSVLSIFESNEGQLWIGTDGGGLNKLEVSTNGYTFSSFPENQTPSLSLSGNVVKSIFKDSNGKFWIGTFGNGLDRYDPEAKAMRHFNALDNVEYPLNSNNIWSIEEDRKGKIWLGTLGGGINVMDPVTFRVDIMSHDPDDPGSIASNDIMDIHFDQSGNVWVGTGDHGLDLWKKETNTFLHFRHDPENPASLSNDEVRSIFEDREGNLWIGTEGGGLNRMLSNGSFKRYTVRDGLIANSVVGITQDQEDMIWITTFRGISRLDPKTGEFLNFDFHTGQNNNQFNQNAILTLQDGRILFGGINGLNMIRPEQVKEELPVPDLIFTGLVVLNQEIRAQDEYGGKVILEKPIEDADEIHLDYTDNSFSIQFAALDYTNPSGHVFEYKMEGFDEEWQATAPGEYRASYTNLDPGDFVFRVRHRGREISLGVVITPPFWDTAWFRVLVLVVAAATLFLVIYFVMKRRENLHAQEMLEAERQILQLKNAQLQSQVSAKNSKLMFSAVQMAHKNEILSTVKEELQSLEKGSDQKLQQLMRRLDREIMSEDYWKEFNVYFEQVDHKFVHEIYEKHPDLTNHDLRLCTLLRINLSTKEIASLLNISVRGVEKARYRLKKRLGLTRSQDLAKYIAGFQNHDLTTE